ncbi:MAG: di-trans,poly-cis-decaprenylcistransferase [Deltaproteobacteria bacterium]|jgi:undecaprenyl diphosphate synthase|nr:di-trans,poly-cis-decaprenylcistransferase [Deltaproteobacteria bacterium]
MDPNTPNHVAIIMDGNGRWAEARGLPRSEGHKAGAEPVRTILKAAHREKIRYLTLYTFSTENWNRSKEEVDNLFTLLVKYIDQETMELFTSGVQLKGTGDLDRLPKMALDTLREAEKITAVNTDLTLTLALSYGSRAELARAAKQIARKVSSGELNPDKVSEETLLSEMWTAALPDVDLLIRTGGDIRVSNFLLWHIAYAELHFTETLWPDFGESHLLAALEDFRSRKRRFGRAG